MSNTKKNVSTANTTTAKGNTKKGNTAKGKKVENTTTPTTTETPKPTPVNWARLTEAQRASIVNAVSGIYGSISSIKKPENKAEIINNGIPVTIGEKVTVYHFNDKGYISMLKAVKDTRKAELKKDIKTLKTGYDFNRALYDRFVWAMGTPQYAQYCKTIKEELGEISPDTVSAWVEKFFPYQDKEHGIMFPVWVCAKGGDIKTPGIQGKCAKMLLYPETYTTGTAARVFSACIDNWGKLASKAIGVTKVYMAPTTYVMGTVLEVCKFDHTTGEKGVKVTISGTDFYTAYGAGELTTVARWRKALELAKGE